VRLEILVIPGNPAIPDIPDNPAIPDNPDSPAYSGISGLYIKRISASAFWALTLYLLFFSL
jgi:hypothetical protein